MLHAYRPLAFYDGKILKYSGMVSPENRELWQFQWAVADKPYLPGVTFLDTYIADRISTDSHTPYNKLY